MDRADLEAPAWMLRSSAHCKRSTTEAIVKEAQRYLERTETKSTDQNTALESTGNGSVPSPTKSLIPSRGSIANVPRPASRRPADANQTNGSFLKLPGAVTPSKEPKLRINLW